MPDERYEKLARETDWRHELQTPLGVDGWMFHDKCQQCGSPESLGTCPAKLAQALERAALEALRPDPQCLACVNGKAVCNAHAVARLAELKEGK